MGSEVALSFNGHRFAFFEVDGIVWIDARSVFQFLYGEAILKQVEMETMLGRVSHHDRRVVDGRHWLSESAMYVLAMRTQCANCEGFVRWLSEDVLPKLRRTGRYEMEPMPLPRSYAEALEAAAAVERQRELLALEVKQLAPKARMVDEFIAPEDWIPNREASKILYGATGEGPNRLLKTLDRLRVLYRSSEGHLVAYQDPWVNGLLIRSQRVLVSGHLRSEVQYSAKGLVRIYEILRASGEDVTAPDWS